MLESAPPILQNMILFENKVIADVISLGEVMLGVGWSYSDDRCPYQKGRCGHREETTGEHHGKTVVLLPQPRNHQRPW